MPVLPCLAAPAPAPAHAARLAPPRPPSPRIPLPMPASSFPFRNSRTKRGPSFATAADAPLGAGPLPEPEPEPEPEERDPLHLLAALRAARIRDEEYRRPDPLFIDPYAAALISLDLAQEKDCLVSHLMPSADHYRLVTRYVDDKLQHWISSSDDLRQIVLLTDGMDTRPYRLSWPRLSVVYDVSPGKVFSIAAQQLKGAGAKVSRNCVVLHTSLESPDLQEGLCKNGFSGNRPSLWVLQGLPLFTSTSLENLLLVISNLSMKGSVFIGELPQFPEWTTAANMASEKDRLEHLFFTRGFRISFVCYQKVAKDIGLTLASPRENCGRILFIAEQLRFSDAQMESFRMHLERLDEDADEEGFEEL